MKYILNLFFAVSVLAFSTTTLAERTAAAGNDPNAEISSLSEAGTFMDGTDFKNQKKVCKSCQNLNGTLLSDTKGNAGKISGSTSGASGTTTSGQGHK